MTDHYPVREPNVPLPQSLTDIDNDIFPARYLTQTADIGSRLWFFLLIHHPLTTSHPMHHTHISSLYTVHAFLGLKSCFPSSSKAYEKTNKKKAGGI
jgi:hypothetical protein